MGGATATPTTTATVADMVNLVKDNQTMALLVVMAIRETTTPEVTANSLKENTAHNPKEDMEETTATITATTTPIVR